VNGIHQATEQVVLLTARTIAAAVASGLAAGHASVAGGLTAAVGVTSRLTAAVASVASGLTATIAGVAGRLAAAVVAAAAVLCLALREQALQPAEQVVLLSARTIAAAVASVTSRLAATVSGVTSRLTAGNSRITSRLAAAIGIAARLAAAIASVTCWLTTRITGAVMAEHPIKELETIRLATNGRAECQHAEEQHTLHRATSPLLVNHARS